jgi:Na+/melibiose symporter-like transporter
MFASPAAPLSALTLPLLLFLPPYYANDLGLGLAVVGFVFGMTRLFDVVTDLAAGVLIDRFPTRWGRRKPWLVLALPFLLVAIYFLFFPEPGVGQFYLWFWMVVMYLGFTLANIAHYAWAAELSADYNERSRIMAMIQFMQAIGLLAIIFVPVVMTLLDRPLAQPTLVAIMGGAIMLLYPLTIMLSIASTGEKPGKAATIRWRDAVDLLRGNRPLRRLIAVDFLNTFIAGAMAGSLLFFLTSVVAQPGSTASLAVLAGLLSSIPTYLLWPFLARRWGKHRASVVVATIGVAGVVALALTPAGSLPAFLFGWALFSIATNGILLLLKAITADIVDLDHVQSGSERSGLMFAILTMVNKLGLATSQGVTYPLLAYFGFSAAGPNDATAMAALCAVFIVIPGAMFAAIALMIWNFPLDEARQKELRSLIDARKARAAAAE